MTSPARPTATRLRAALGSVVALALLGAGLSTSSAVADVTKPTVTADKSAPDALKVSWTDAKGAASYRVQYSTSADFRSQTTTVAEQDGRQITGSEATLTDLDVGQAYFVRVADVGKDGTVGAYSAATQATPAYTYATPGDLFRSKVDRDEMTVAWKAISGAPGYSVRAYAKGSPTKYFTTTTSSVRLTGLKKSTTYYLKVHVVRPAAGSKAEVRLSADSPEVTQATTGYALATPDGFRETSQGSSSVGLAWTAVAGAPAGSAYRISYALDGAQTDHKKTTGAQKGTTGRITGLANDTTYYATLYLTDAKGNRLTASSDFIVAKSVVPRGTISGKVSGVTGSDLTAAAYGLPGNVVDAVTVGSDGKYALRVRPGTYKVQLMYTGGGGFASAWAVAKHDGGWTFGSGSSIVVASGKTTTAPDVRIHAGRVVKGKVVSRAGAAIRAVDLTAIAARGSERDVISLTRSGTDGSFSLRGLNPGTYWVRAIYSGDGFRTESVQLKVTRDLGVKVVLDTMPFRKRYGASISGTAKVGKRVTVHATRWLAGTYPTTQASMSYSWKRNGKAIKGAHGSTYKITGADRGRRLTVTATAKRYGYTTGSVTSKSKTVH